MLFKIKLYALAIAGFLGALFAFGKHKESQGKSKEKAEQSERLLDDIKKANAAKRDSDLRKRVFDEDNS